MTTAMSINEMRKVLEQVQARINAGQYVRAVEISPEDLSDLIEAWDLLFKIADEHQREYLMGANRDCLLCDARELVQSQLWPGKRL